jgi:hypothetical protein
MVPCRSPEGNTLRMQERNQLSLRCTINGSAIVAGLRDRQDQTR